jgi:hypothetical protein
MNKFNKTALLLAVSLTALLVSGCDYVPRAVYEIETKDGKILKLLCPTVDRDRNRLTYVIDSECVAIK